MSMCILQKLVVELLQAQASKGVCRSGGANFIVLTWGAGFCGLVKVYGVWGLGLGVEG